MSWTPQKTWTSEVLTASDLNTYLRDDMEYLKAIADGVSFAGVQLVRSTNQSISDSTATNITWESESLDFGGWWASGTDIIVPAGVIPSGFTSIAVLVFASLKYATNATGARKILVLKNGASVGQWTVSGISGESTDVQKQLVTTAVAGDTFTVQAYQTSTGSLNVTEGNVTVLRYAPAS